MGQIIVWKSKVFFKSLPVIAVTKTWESVSLKYSIRTRTPGQSRSKQGKGWKNQELLFNLERPAQKLRINLNIQK